MSRLSRRPSRRVAATLAAVTAAASASLMGTGSASSAPVDDGCPTPFPVSELSADQPVSGLSVSHGTTPGGFTGEVLGVVDDGIAPGLDMIMVRLSSPDLDRVGGIWEGMSGSPVYAADGRLIGAVAYGLSAGPSPVAGVTPAAAMEDVLSATSGARDARVAHHVDLPRAVQRRIVAQRAATRAEAASGMSQLRIPVAISGLGSHRLKDAKKTLGLKNVRVYRASAAAANTPVGSSAADIVPGGNLAVSLSYGDYSAVAVGTVTAVCGDRMVGFGHPMTFAGDTTLTMHGADAVYVQEDPTFAPFKLANPTGPVGTVSQDRQAGVAGIVGPRPETSTITATATATEAGAAPRSRTGVTEVSVPDFLSQAAFYTAIGNQDRVFDRYGAGSAKVDFTIHGTTDDGQPFTLDRTNRFESSYDISAESAFELPRFLDKLLDNKFTDLTIDDVTTTASLTDQQRRFHLGKVELIGEDGSATPVPNRAKITAAPGDVLTLRVTLKSFRDRYPSLTSDVSLTIPKKASPGSRGYLSLSGGQRYGFYFGDLDGDVALASSDVSVSGGAKGDKPKSLTELIEKLENQPRNDELTARLYVGSPRGGQAIRRHSAQQVDEVVKGSRFYRVRIEPKACGHRC